MTAVALVVFAAIVAAAVAEVVHRWRHRDVPAPFIPKQRNDRSVDDWQTWEQEMPHRTP